MSDELDPALVEVCAKALAGACYKDGVPRDDEGHFQSRQFEFRDQARAVLREAGVPEMVKLLKELRDVAASTQLVSKYYSDQIDAALSRYRSK